jgi:hypothetical protein
MMGVCSASWRSSCNENTRSFNFELAYLLFKERQQTLMSDRGTASAGRAFLPTNWLRTGRVGYERDALVAKWTQ